MFFAQWGFGLCWSLIIYTYLLFPLLLAGLARRKRGDESSPAFAEATHEENLPRVAMVVAAYNEAAVLPAKLANTWQINYPADKFTLVIGSDGSDDDTPKILAECSDPRLQAHAFTARRGKISVLNDIAARTNAEILVMSDANTMFQPEAVRELVRHFADPRIGCVSGELGLEQNGGVSGEGIYWKYEGWIKRNESRLGFLIGCNGGIFALRRVLYEPLPASTIVEDFVLTLRVLERGFQVRFAPEARATEPACESASAEMVRKIRIGAGGFQALGLTRGLLHPRCGAVAFAFWSHKVLRWLVPQFFLFALLANLALLRLPFFQVTLALQIVGALLAVRAYRAGPGQAGGMAGKLGKITRPVSYFYLMNYALLCGFFRFLFGTQRVTWDRAVPNAPVRPVSEIARPELAE